MINFYNNIRNSFMYFSLPSTLFHEFGHKIAVNILFSNANPHINFNLEEKYAECIWIKNKNLTVIGNLFSVDTCEGIVAAAGPTFDLVNIALSSCLACHMMDRNVIVSYIFFLNAFTKASNLYEYSKLEYFDGHDFFDMSKHLKISRSMLQRITEIILAATIVIPIKRTVF